MGAGNPLYLRETNDYEILEKNLVSDYGPSGRRSMVQGDGGFQSGDELCRRAGEPVTGGCPCFYLDVKSRSFRVVWDP